MATETKKLSKTDQVLNKIDAFFTKLFAAEKDEKEADDLEEDDDMEGKKAEDDEEAKKGKKAKKAEKEDDEDEKESKKSAKKAKKATDEEDSQDPDDDDDDDKDEEGDDDDDKDDVYGKKDAEIKRLNKIIAKQNGLLKEAQASLSERDEDVRETIKSTFKPQGSQRSTKTAIKTEAPAFAQPTTDMAKRAAALANKQKRS